MKLCPFLVAGRSMQALETRPDVIPIVPADAGADAAATNASLECLGSPCRFFHAGGCRFDALFDSQEQAVAAATVVSASGTGTDAGAVAALASLPSVLEEVWTLQRESLREVLSGFRKIEAAQAALVAGVATQVHSQVAQVETGVVDALAKHVRSIEAAVNACEAAMGRVQTDVESLRTQLGAVETQVKATGESKPALGPEILDLVGRHFEALERDVHQIETAVRSGLGDSLRTFVRESQSAAMTGAETSLRAVLEGVQAAVRSASQDSNAALRALVEQSQSTVQGTVERTTAAVRMIVEDSQGTLRSQLARTATDGQTQVQQGLVRLGEELQGIRDSRIQIQAALDGLMRETRDMSSVARRVESSQVLTHELLDEQRQVHELVEARERRERARQLNNAGVTSYHQGAYDTSVQRFKEATELDPALAEAYNNLGLSYTEMGREEEAIVAFQRAIETEPATSSVYNNLGYLYYRKGDLDHAVEMYQRAIQRGSDTGAAYCNLGNAYYRLRRVDAAVQAWRRALEIDPANAKAAAALERLGLESRPI